MTECLLNSADPACISKPCEKCMIQRIMFDFATKTITIFIPEGQVISPQAAVSSCAAKMSAVQRVNIFAGHFPFEAFVLQPNGEWKWFNTRTSADGAPFFGNPALLDKGFREWAGKLLDEAALPPVSNDIN